MVQVAVFGSNSESRNAALDRLGDEIAVLAAHVHAATYELLVRLGEFDRRNGWTLGFRSCAHWLSWRTGIAPGAAREKVRVARALGALPLISDAMRRGQFSFAKVRALTRVATPVNEADLLQVAHHATAAQVETIVRAWRRVDRLEEQREEQKRHESRGLTLYVQEDGMYELRGRLTPEVGVLLQRVLQVGSEVLYGRRGSPIEDQGSPVDDRASPSQKRADAIGWLAERALADGESVVNAGRCEVVLHVDGDALHAASTIVGQAVLDVGRRTRTVPPAIRRALEQRDRGCRFPGCGLRFCDAHHIVHWADGGATRLVNLMLLCRRHHRLVHEGGIRVERDAAAELRFYRPDGRLVANSPEGPQLLNDATAVWAASHTHLGIGAATTTPRGNGERLDADLAIRTLRRTSEARGVPDHN